MGENANSIYRYTDIPPVQIAKIEIKQEVVIIYYDCMGNTIDLQPFISLIVLALGAFLVRKMLSMFLLRLESTLVAKTRQDLPPVYKLFLSGLFAKKSPLKPIADGNNDSNKEVKPKIVIQVEQMQFTAKEKEEFKKLCEYPSTTSPSTNNENEISSSLMHVFPHVIGQQFIVSLICHPHFPISAIGSLHLKSYFEVLQANLLKEFLSNGSSTSFSMQGNYWGCVPNQKKGTDLICSLEILHNPTAKTIWKELIVIYSTNNARQTDAGAQKILEQYSNYCDFTNIDVTKSAALNQVASTKDETWNYGMLSGDINPIHMSEIGAKLFGQRGRIAHGAMILGKALSHLEQREKMSVPSKFGVSFKGPIPCGSTLELKGSQRDSMTDKEKNEVRDIDLYVVKNDRPNICLREYK